MGPKWFAHQSATHQGVTALLLFRTWLPLWVLSWLLTFPAPLVAVDHSVPGRAVPQVDSLEAELLSLPPAIGQPGFIQPWGEYLLGSDWLGDPNLHVLDRTTGELTVSFGRIGRGPGEFSGMLAGVQRPSHDTSAVRVFDGRRLTRIGTPGPIGTDAPAIELAIPSVLRAVWLDSTAILGVIREPPEERFVFLDEDGVVTTAVSGVLLGHEGIPLAQRVEASARFSLCVHPEGAGFALVYKRAAIVQIYDHAATYMVDAAVPYPIEASFDRVDGETVFVSKRLTYSSCWADTGFLYALFSGEDYATASPGTLGGQEIHVFEWGGGGLVRILYLDARIFGFSVDLDSGWLYGGSLEDAGIYRFRLADGSHK